MRVIVRTPCRLHFALMDLNGELGRADGSLGVAIDKPNVILEARSHSDLKVTGERSDFIEHLALKFMRHHGISSGALIEVKSMIPGHVGLGSSTQSSLAVASALTRIHRLNESTRELAGTMGRGGTSGIGVAAFERGGLILDGGHSFGHGKEKQTFLPSRASKARPPPVVARYDFPLDWIFVVAIPTVTKGAHGQDEVKIFQERCPISPEKVAETCRVIVMKILPALVEEDIVEFGEGLNRLQEVGFAAATKDLVNPIVLECMEFVRASGGYAAGQSSFGPATFGLARGEEQAARLQKRVQEFLDQKVGGTTFRTKANNVGATITCLGG